MKNGIIISEKSVPLIVEKLGKLLQDYSSLATQDFFISALKDTNKSISSDEDQLPKIFGNDFEFMSDKELFPCCRLREYRTSDLFTRVIPEGSDLFKHAKGTDGEYWGNGNIMKISQRSVTINIALLVVEHSIFFYENIVIFEAIDLDPSPETKKVQVLRFY